ncbi:MAG: class II glutamine amidotransferase [candidate division WOR-3 bacterium]
MSQRKNKDISYFTFLFIILSFTISCRKNLEQNHECRFWGIILSENSPAISDIITTHLDSLRKLGANNPDGWGIAYFIESYSDTILPVIRRGEPSAPLDPRYSEMTKELLRNVKNSAVAHVRKGSSGPTGGIPDPHPFRRQCINRRLDILFAHNGTINTDILLRLISAINPLYLEQNPPDYSPNYLDSDLYSILLVEVMDAYPDLSIEECIKIAVVKLDSALGMSNAQLNFVMSSGNTLWALNFTKSEPRAITVYYYPDSLISNFWVVASQPLDTSTQKWVQIPNRTIACLKPGEPVHLIPIYQKYDRTGKDATKNFILQPNPFNKSININYYVSKPGIVKINIYDESGRLVRRLLDEFKIAGEYVITWDGRDEANIILPNGIYFCHIQNENELKNLKIIFVN